MPELTPCPLPAPPEPLQLPKDCGGYRYTEGEGPDAVIVCVRCKARWSLDSKEASS